MMLGPLQIIGTEWIWVILVILLLFMGEKRLPKLARDLGRAFSEFQRGRMEVERELNKVRRGLDLDIKPTTIKPKVGKIEPIIQSTNPKEFTSKISEELTDELEESEKLTKAAQALGIDVEGKTNEQLKEEIKQALGID